MSYGNIFWRKSPHSSIIFRIQKKAIRIMEGCGNRVSCRNVFNTLHAKLNPICHLLALLGARHILHVSRIRVKKLQILPLTSQYMLSFLMFVVQNKNFFLTNNENHNLDTRQRNNLYRPQANLSIYQRGAFYLGIKIFNNLPLEIKNVAGNQKKFKIALTKFLYTYSFHTIEEYLSQS
jgi:hypothetical protein